ncbi:MAG: pyridoxal phosphate-dependent aminotransferase [Sedimenticolaceae bacterium]|nr:pyridoxal phosphate-dependent aminotransferase [Sedimenticolaceae bacterium]
MPSSRVNAVQPFHVMDILARARELQAQGRDIIHMEVGEPDFPTPQPVVEAGQRALAEGRTRYTPALGIPELREAISAWYRERFGIEVPAARIVITPGSSTGLQMLISALADSGDRILLPDPGYPCNRNFVKLFDAEPLSLPMAMENGWVPVPEQIREHWKARTRALIIATPSNPTGSVLSLEQLGAISRTVSGLGGALIVDEIYQGLSYDVEPVTALSLDTDNLFIVNSFSKYFGMTGWRLGWLVVPEAWVPVMDRLAQNLYLSAPTIAQYAALAAMQPATVAILEERRAAFHARRDFLYPALEQLGFGLAEKPRGAFYLYADCSGLTGDSFAFCERMLEDAGVAITPGKDFGFNEPQRYVRFAYTTSVERMQLAVERLEQAIR